MRWFSCAKVGQDVFWFCTTESGGRSLPDSPSKERVNLVKDWNKVVTGVYLADWTRVELRSEDWSAAVLLFCPGRPSGIVNETLQSSLEPRQI